MATQLLSDYTQLDTSILTHNIRLLRIIATCFDYFSVAITRLYGNVTYCLHQGGLKWSEKKRQCGYSGAVETSRAAGEEKKRSSRGCHIGAYIPNYTALPSALISNIKDLCVFILSRLFLSFSHYIMSLSFVLSFLRLAFQRFFLNPLVPELFF